MNKTIRCVIIDDEPPAIRILERYITKIPFMECIATYTNPLEVLKIVNNTEIDVVFLDIQMPELTGLQLSKLLKTNTKIIFTTAYPQYAIDGFELSAVDYLVKPIAFDRFYQACLKLQPKEDEKVAVETKEASEAYFFFKTDGKHNYVKVFVSDILYIEGLKNYLAVHLKNEQIIIYKTLKQLKEELSETRFIQIHKSFIIALNAIDKIENTSVWIHDNELPIGNTYRKAFFEKIEGKKV